MAQDSNVLPCKGCGTNIERPSQGRGSTREWCSNACRQRSVKHRKAERITTLLREVIDEGNLSARQLALLSELSSLAYRRSS